MEHNTKRCGTILERSEDYAVRIVNLCKHLRHTRGEYVLSKQLLRSGTSIGANVAEAQRAQSRADFLAKMSNGEFEYAYEKTVGVSVENVIFSYDYYGKYNGYYLFTFSCPHEFFPTESYANNDICQLEIEPYELGGYTFRYTTHQRLLLVRE